MPAVLPAAPAERFARLIDGLCRAVAARLERPGRPGLAGPLIILIGARLRGILIRVVALIGRIAAGRCRHHIACRRAPRPGPRRPVQRPWPHAGAWLIRLVPEAAAAASQFRHLLADPEFAALLDVAPQMRRLLRPLGHMLGVRLPPPRPAAPAVPAAEPLPSPAAPPAAAPSGATRPPPPAPDPFACGPSAPAKPA